MRYLRKYRLKNGEVFAIDVSPPNASAFVFSYIVRGEDAGDCCLLVDPGPASSHSALSKYLLKLGCARVHLFLTHIHIDHSGAAGDLAMIFRDKIKVYVHPKGAPHLVNPERLWAGSLKVLNSLAITYGRPTPVPEEAIVTTKDYEVFKVGGLEVLVVHTPGHAPHHQSALLSNELLFSGESLGMYFEEFDATLLASPPPFKYDAYMDSVAKQRELSPRLIALPHNTITLFNNQLDLNLRQIELWKKASRAAENFEEFLNILLGEDLNLRRLWGINLDIIKKTILSNLTGAYEELRGASQ